MCVSFCHSSPGSSMEVTELSLCVPLGELQMEDLRHAEGKGLLQDPPG